jgi:hypothetical protein
MIPMNPAIKIVVAILVAALIVVVGLIVVTQNNAKEAAPAATTAPQATQLPQETAAPQAAEDLIPEGTENEYIAETQSSADNEAQGADETAENEEAQGTMYEGALAGLTEEEIAALALAEEQHSSANMSDDDGQEGPID